MSSRYTQHYIYQLKYILYLIIDNSKKSLPPIDNVTLVTKPEITHQTIRISKYYSVKHAVLQRYYNTNEVNRQALYFCYFVQNAEKLRDREQYYLL